MDWRPFIETEFDAARDESEGLRHSWSLAKRKGEVATGQSGEAAPVGDQRVKSIHRSLDSFTGFPRSAGQRRFHDAFIRASLPHIYGNVDFERHRDRIMLANDMTTVDYNCIVCTPRRFGKTTAVSMYCATLLATCPDMWISVFSTGQRASSSLLEQTAKFFRMLPNEGDVRGGNDNILKKNTEELFTKGSVPSDMRRMYSYPSTVAGLKGVGGKVLILEEASRLDEAVFKEVVLPLLAVQDTVMLAISTPMDENNFYSVMLEMKKPNGELLFNVLQITLLCDACQKEGKIECPHKNELPAWKSGERQEMIASLMANDRNLYIQENLGIVVKRDASAFEKIAVDRFADPAGFFTVALAPSPPVVYVCIDPAGGGPSCMALVACFFTGGGQLIICGSESGTVVNDTAQEQLLVGFMARLRNVTNFHGSRIVLIIERNFGGAPLASRIAGVCSRFRPICAMSQVGGVPPPMPPCLSSEWGDVPPPCPPVFRRDGGMCRPHAPLPFVGMGGCAAPIPPCYPERDMCRIQESPDFPSGICAESQDSSGMRRCYASRPWDAASTAPDIHFYHRRILRRSCGASAWC